MSVCGQTEDESASEEGGAPARDIYEQKAVSKVVRVLTVLAYLLSVSLAAILLSVYYICVWKSPELPPLNDTEGQPSARRSDLEHHHIKHAGHSLVVNFIGRSNITVNESTTQPIPADFSSSSTDTTSPPDSSDPGLDWTPDSSTASLTPPHPYNDTSDDVAVYNATNIT